MPQNPLHLAVSCYWHKENKQAANKKSNARSLHYTPNLTLKHEAFKLHIPEPEAQIPSRPWCSTCAPVRAAHELQNESPYITSAYLMGLARNRSLSRSPSFLQSSVASFCYQLWPLSWAPSGALLASNRSVARAVTRPLLQKDRPVANPMFFGPAPKNYSCGMSDALHTVTKKDKMVEKLAARLVCAAALDKPGKRVQKIKFNCTHPQTLPVGHKPSFW